MIVAGRGTLLRLPVADATTTQQLENGKCARYNDHIPETIQQHPFNPGGHAGYPAAKAHPLNGAQPPNLLYSPPGRFNSHLLRSIDLDEPNTE
jgi:hypothetical protein